MERVHALCEDHTHRLCEQCGITASMQSDFDLKAKRTLWELQATAESLRDTKNHLYPDSKETYLFSVLFRHKYEGEYQMLSNISTVSLSHVKESLPQTLDIQRDIAVVLDDLAQRNRACAICYCEHVDIPDKPDHVQHEVVVIDLEEFFEGLPLPEDDVAVASMDYNEDSACDAVTGEAKEERV